MIFRRIAEQSPRLLAAQIITRLSVAFAVEFRDGQIDFILLVLEDRSSLIHIPPCDSPARPPSFARQSRPTEVVNPFTVTEVVQCIRSKEPIAPTPPLPPLFFDVDVVETAQTCLCVTLINCTSYHKCNQENGGELEGDHDTVVYSRSCG